MRIWRGDTMSKKVIHIYGTSIIGKYISDKWGFYFMDTNNYFWQATNPPYTKKRDVSERLSMMRKDIDKHEKVVIASSLVDWGDELISLFSLAIRVETDTNVRIERLMKWEREYFGIRINIGGDMRSKAKHDEWQVKLSCKCILLDGSLPLEENFQIIQSYI